MNDEEVIVEDYKVIERTVIATEGFFLAEYVGICQMIILMLLSSIIKTLSQK